MTSQEGPKVPTGIDQGQSQSGEVSPLPLPGDKRNISPIPHKRLRGLTIATPYLGVLAVVGAVIFSAFRGEPTPVRKNDEAVANTRAGLVAFFVDNRSAEEQRADPFSGLHFSHQMYTGFLGHGINEESEIDLQEAQIINKVFNELQDPAKRNAVIEEAIAHIQQRKEETTTVDEKYLWNKYSNTIKENAEKFIAMCSSNTPKVRCDDVESVLNYKRAVLGYPIVEIEQLITAYRNAPLQVARATQVAERQQREIKNP